MLSGYVTVVRSPRTLNAFLVPAFRRVISFRRNEKKERSGREEIFIVTKTCFCIRVAYLGNVASNFYVRVS